MTKQITAVTLLALFSLLTGCKSSEEMLKSGTVANVTITQTNPSFFASGRTFLNIVWKDGSITVCPIDSFRNYSEVSVGAKGTLYMRLNEFGDVISYRWVSA